MAEITDIRANVRTTPGIKTRRAIHRSVSAVVSPPRDVTSSPPASGSAAISSSGDTRAESFPPRPSSSLRAPLTPLSAADGETCSGPSRGVFLWGPLGGLALWLAIGLAIYVAFVWTVFPTP